MPLRVPTIAGDETSGRGEDVDDADGTDSDHVREPDAGARMLAIASLAPKLCRQLADLPDTRRPDGVAHRQEASRGAHCDAPTDVELAVGELRGRLADRGEPDRFDVEQLLDGERVVQLDHIQLARAHTGLTQGDAGGLTRERSVEVLAAVDGLGP